MYDVPAFVWVIELFAVIGIIAATVVALGRTASDTRTRLVAGAAVVLGGWMGVSAYFASQGVYRQDPGETVPWIGVAIGGVILTTLLAARLPVVADALADPGAAARLVVPQTFRVVGVVFLILMVTGDLPAVFALPAGLGDIAIGIAAPFVARRLRRDPSWSGAVAFNLLGILDLVVAIGVGFLSAPGPRQAIFVSPTTEPMGLLPLALIPTVVVPLAVGLHVLSLRRLARRQVTAPAHA
jgi:hypothetical protein